VAEVESKLVDANKSRVFDGLIGVHDVAAKFRDLSLDRRGVSAPTRGGNAEGVSWPLS